MSNLIYGNPRINSALIAALTLFSLWYQGAPYL